MDEDKQPADKRSAHAANQVAPVPSPRALPEDGIHSDAAEPSVTSPGGACSASTETPEIGGGHTAPRSPSTPEGGATASKSPPTDPDAPYRGTRSRKVKEPIYLQIDNQDLTVASEELMRKTDLRIMPQPFCTHCISIMNDHEAGEGWHETCKRKKLPDDEVHNQISIVLAQTVKVNRLIDIDNDQTLIRVREECNQEKMKKYNRT